MYSDAEKKGITVVTMCVLIEIKRYVTDAMGETLDVQGDKDQLFSGGSFKDYLNIGNA